MKSVGSGRIWAGRVLTVLAAAFLLMDGILKVIKNSEAVRATVDLGFDEKYVPVLGWILLIFLAIFSIRKFSVIGLILISGYLAGAVAIQLRAQNPLFSHILFPVYLLVLIWTGSLLRNEKLKSLLIKH